jgi:hypothetical protein
VGDVAAYDDGLGSSQGGEVGSGVGGVDDGVGGFTGAEAAEA